MNRSDHKHDGRGRWEAPKLILAGSVADVRGGGGKLSPMADDTGDVRKPKGQEP